MAPSVIYTRASASLTTTSTPSIRRSLTSTRIHRCRDAPARSLWWWGAHGTWGSAPDENIEERLQRHQKIMRHRYSRSLRRRALWDRDDSPSCSTGRSSDECLGRRWGFYKPVPITDPSMDKSGFKHGAPSVFDEHPFKTRAAFEMIDRDFEAFKVAVDRAVQRDPYGAVFGRRLHSLPAENNASWVSWLFNLDNDVQHSAARRSKEPDKRRVEIEVLDKREPTNKSETNEVNKTGTGAALACTEADTSTRYVYDPVSGRKVLRNITEFSPTSQASQSPLGALFSGNGDQTPNQTLRHRKVHDHMEAASTAVFESGGKETPSQSGADFKSSHTHECQQIHAAALRDSIDAGTEFHGKFIACPPIEGEMGQEKIRRMPESDGDDPLFSGTTYEARTINSIPAPTNTWLVREGFQSKGLESSKQKQGSGTRENRLEPSLDRIKSHPEDNVRRFTSKLQPAIDRSHIVKPSEPLQNVLKPLQVASTISSKDLPKVAKARSRSFEQDTKEDMDLLRASDVRAATRSMRTTKQEIAQAKNERRNQLDSEFEQLQHKLEEAVPDAVQIRTESGRLSHNPRRHMEQQPGGIVAATINSTSVSGNSTEVGNKPLDALVSVCEQSTPKPTASPGYNSQGAKDDEEPRTDPTESLSTLAETTETTETTVKPENWKDTQNQGLTSGIRQIYDTDQGPINLSLVRSSISIGTEKALTPDQLTGSRDEAAISTVRSLRQQLDQPPEDAKLMTEINQVRKDTNAVRNKTDGLLRNPKLSDVSGYNTEINGLLAEARNISDRVSHLETTTDKHLNEERTKKQQHPHPLSTATVKPGVARHAEIERHMTVFEPRYIQMLSELRSVTKQLQEISDSIDDMRSRRQKTAEPTVNPSTKSTDSTQVSTHSLTAASTRRMTAPSSPYLILVYNKTTAEVDLTEMQRLPWATAGMIEIANPIRIMGSLRYPAAFVTHFAQLEKAGYELTGGSGDMLVFKKAIIAAVKSTKGAVAGSTTSTKPASALSGNTVAVEEASAQPEISETIAQPRNSVSKQAAAVLNEIPTEVQPLGPAAPTAPARKIPRSGPKVRRQEQVFSGTLPLRSPSETIGPSSSASRQPGKQGQTRDRRPSSKSSHTDESADPSFFARTTRAVKRGVIGVTAFGAAAYAVGAVAEGIGAQAQVEGDNTLGPRRKVVMPLGQRPGIYSTESSRD